METLNEWVVTINDYIWTYMLVGALIIVGVTFTVKSNFVQFRYIREMVRLLGDGVSNKENKHSISSFQAFCISIASRVGTGNMAGVATAIAIGGPAAVFWMWVIALIGAASSFVESTLAQIYKQKNKGSFIGGPAYYMEKGLKKRWMGVLFAVLISITFGMVFNSVQSNTVTFAFEESFGIDRLWSGIFITVLTILVIFGGIQRIARVSSMVVPVMALIYIVVALFVVLINITEVPRVLAAIFENAFGLNQVVGGGLGAGIMQGVRRGLFSNEAGMGSAPNAAATATVSHPVKQGLIQALGVFTDTIVICSCTAFIVLVSDVPMDGSVKGIALTQMAMSQHIGYWAGTFVSVSIFLFAFSSIIGNYYYGESNITFITRKPIYVNLYRCVVSLMVLFGSLASLDIVWNLADLTMALMTITNLIAIVLLGHIAITALKDYSQQKRAGIKEPVYQPWLDDLDKQSDPNEEK